MARIPYASLTGDQTRPLVERITKERGSVLHLYQMLLHSPPVAEGWLKLMTAIRQQCRLNGALRELVIVRVAIINGAEYEGAQHIPIALKEGITQAQIDALGAWETSALFGEKEKRVLALTDEMTKNVRVADATMDALKAHFDEQELVELVATVASYNMVSRFLEALGVHTGDSTSA